MLKKALRSGYADPYAQIIDKAGVRITAHYPWLVPKLEAMVSETFHVEDVDDKRRGTPVQRLDYRGTHFQVRLLAGPPDLSELTCEIQVLSRAESLWADTAHDLSYKPAQPLPEEIDRAIYRLIALVEIFDSEVWRAYQAIRSDDGFREAKLLDALEHLYYQFTAKQSDRELSLIVLAALSGVFDAEDSEQVRAALDGFVADNRPKLSELYGRFEADDHANPLIWQPETILVFLLLERDPFKLAEAWEEVLPKELLVSLADSWGAPIQTS